MTSTSMLTPPPPPSVGTTPIRRLQIAAHRTSVVASVLGKRKAAGRVRLVAERQFPTVSEMGRLARERLRCGEWDAWLRNLHAFLPKARPSLLERRLIQFLDCGVVSCQNSCP